ncbi:hypothetical protein V6N13_026064 [Hibiscus sabdariffa]
MSVFPVRDFRTYKEALTGGVIHTQQKGTNRLTGVDKSHNDINLTAVEEFEDDRRFIDGESPFDMKSLEVTANDASVHVPCINEVEVEGSNSEERPSCGSVEKVGVANFPVRGVRGGVGHVSSSFVAGREMTFESLSNESKLQEVHVDDVVELAR